MAFSRLFDLARRRIERQAQQEAAAARGGLTDEGNAFKDLKERLSMIAPEPYNTEKFVYPPWMSKGTPRRL